MELITSLYWLLRRGYYFVLLYSKTSYYFGGYYFVLLYYKTCYYFGGYYFVLLYGKISYYFLYYISSPMTATGCQLIPELVAGAQEACELS